MKPRCRCGEQHEKEAEPDDLIRLKEIASSCCTCKLETQRTVDTAVCRCKKCVELAHSRFKHDFIISGHREAEGELPTRIIEGVKAHKTECDCLRKYRESIEKYESWKTRNKAVEEMKSAEQKYVIGGVVNRPNQPPVFLISGAEPKRECPCVERFKEEQEEKERIAKMPKKLLGLPYLISGVKETPEGNVFVISGVQTGKKCKCLRLYDAYMQQHEKCVKISEAYDKKMKEELEEYLNELIEGEEESGKEGEGIEEVENKENAQDEEIKDTVESEPVCNDVVQKEQSVHKGDRSTEKVKLVDTNLIVKLEYNKRQSEEEICVCAEPEEVKEEEEEMKLKRFIILDKFPKSKKSQYDILKVCC